MDELTSNNSIGVSLESLLQENRNQTIVLSDILSNTEAAKKSDEKTLEQLKKLSQASTQTLEVAKAQKQQSKDSSKTLKSIQEATNASNAIVAKRQISTLNLINTTLNTGLNAVNQKVFTALESLGSSLAGAFSSVGRSLENKLYNLTGSLSIVLKPLVGIVKIGFTMITKLVAVPLKMLWEGFKAFNETLLGKITTAVLGVYLLYKFLTSTSFGNTIANAINNYRAKNKGGFVDTAMSVGSFVGEHPILTLAGLLLGPRLATTLLTKGGGKLLSKVPALFGRGKTVAAATPSVVNAAPTAAVAAADINSMSKSQLRKYINANGGRHISNTQMGGMSIEQMRKQAFGLSGGAQAESTAANATKMSRLASIGSKIGPKTNIASILGGFALDYAADHVENDKLSGGLHLGSAALSGAGTGAMIGSLIPIPGAGTAIGAILGAGIGIGSSLLFGEGGKKLFGSNEENNEMQQLEQMQAQQNQASTAEIHALESIAEAIRDNNKILTKVSEKQNVDAQPQINRHEASTNEQNRHADAVTTNDTLQKILEKFDSLALAFNNLATSITNAAAKDNPSLLGMTPNIDTGH